MNFQLLSLAFAALVLGLVVCIALDRRARSKERIHKLLAWVREQGSRLESTREIIEWQSPYKTYRTRTFVTPRASKNVPSRFGFKVAFGSERKDHL